MRRLLLAAAALFLAAPAAAQREPEWRRAEEAFVRFNPFQYEPREIRLRAGQPVRLNFVNYSRANLSFRAPRFFETARVRRGDRHRVRNGGLLLRPGEGVEIALVPARGRYHAYSGYLLHRMRGMTARIVVE